MDPRQLRPAKFKILEDTDDYVLIRDVGVAEKDAEIVHEHILQSKPQNTIAQKLGPKLNGRRLEAFDRAGRRFLMRFRPKSSNQYYSIARLIRMHPFLDNPTKSIK